jgi:hypothetical protein
MALVLLICAAVLEVGGDALCRAGLRGSRGGLLMLGGVVLWFYGIMVNASGWNSGRLLGIYEAAATPLFSVPSYTMWASSPCMIVSTRTRLVHVQCASLQRHPLQSRDRRLCLCARGHVDRPEASGFPAELGANHRG